MKKIITIALTTLVVCACSSFKVSTNLDPSNVTNYFKPSAVDVLDQDEITMYNAKAVGAITGLSCQIDKRDFIANESDARTDAKLKALDMGANAVVFNKCVVLENTPACLKSVTCYGEAYIIGDRIK